MAKAKTENKTAEKAGKSKRNTKKKKLNISQILSGIGLLAIAVYTGWIIMLAPSAAGMEFTQYNAVLREQMGIIGSIIYLLMKSLMGNGVLLFPLLFVAAGIALILDRQPTGMQKTGIVLVGLVVLAALHLEVTYITVKDNLLLGLMGSGGGVIGAAVSMLLLKSLGEVGTYIALVCITLVSVIMIGQTMLFKQMRQLFAATKQGLVRGKDAMSNFIFEEIEEESESEKVTPNKSRKQSVLQVAQQEELKKDVSSGEKTDASVSSPRKRLSASKSKAQTKGANGQQGVMSSLQEIHKALGQQPSLEEQPQLFLADPADETIEEPEQMQASIVVTDIAEQEVEDEAVDAVVAEQKTERRKKKVYAEQLPEFTPTEAEECVYQFPPIELLDPNPNGNRSKNNLELKQNVERLEQTLNDFGVKGKIADVSCGPAITQYEFQPAAGVKVSKIVGLSDDIALSMAVAGVRIEAPIPGKAAVGIEIPNKTTGMVCLREVVESDVFQNSKSKLTVALGKDISGQPIVTDLAKMPHLLIAGSTGSGKSVCMNALINSILYKATPDEVKFLMVDPKKVELGNYNGIPHLISPVVTDAKKAASALRWAVHEMERRYELFASNGVKDMPRFNALSEQRRMDAQTEEEKAGIEIMPYIVVLIDELADLMMVAPADVEDAICRLAQMARAAGIHLVVATQRPSVDVITGIIKANIPSRIAFAVSSQIDSRTILDMAGAEKLLGRGDMLFYPTGLPKPQRIQGVYVSDKEIDRIVEAVKVQGQPIYNEEVVNVEIKTEVSGSEEAEEWDDLIPEATKLFIENGQASISLLQRRFRVGYTRAARIVDQMEQRGLVGPYEGSKPRQIKVTMAQYNEMIENGEL